MYIYVHIYMYIQILAHICMYRYSGVFIHTHIEARNAQKPMPALHCFADSLALQDEKTPVHHAAVNDHIEALTLLIEAGGDVNAGDKVSTYRAMHLDR